MSFMIWNDAFNLGIKEIDEHHRHLVALLNLTYDVFTQGTSHDGIVEVLDELVDYAKYHFDAEEYWMEVYKYPDLLQHRGEHVFFRQRVNEFQSDFHKRKTNLSLEVLQFLNSWLTAHILNTDNDYGRFAVHLSHAEPEPK